MRKPYLQKKVIGRAEKARFQSLKREDAKEANVRQHSENKTYHTAAKLWKTTEN